MDNMWIYNKVKKTPKEAQKAIEAGRLAGFTDINPMWRIKKLTELFGPCGEGWKTEIVSAKVIDGATKYYAKGKGEEFRSEECVEKCVVIDLLLFYRKQDGSWSDGVFGTGGAMLVTAEKFAPYTDDDCFKKAYTDAISCACKQLGFSEDIYFSKAGNDDSNKHNGEEIEADPFKKTVTKAESKQIVAAAQSKWGEKAAEKCSVILDKYGANSTLSLLQIYLPTVLEEIKNAD